MKAKGLEVSREYVTQDIIKRDYNDSSRKHAPLAPASDAVIVDSTAMTIEQVIAKMLDVIQSKTSNGEK